MSRIPIARAAAASLCAAAIAASAPATTYAQGVRTAANAPPPKAQLRQGRAKRIINGEDARRGAIPWQAALISASQPGDTRSRWQRQFCGGAFITRNIVLTAAHCVTNMFGNADGFRVGHGDRDLNSGGMREYEVTDIVMHPRYRAQNADYDFAILKVSGRVPASDTIDILTPAENRRVTVDDVAVVSGWGTTNEQTGETAQRLQRLEVLIKSRSDCNDADSYNGAITSRMLCAGFGQGGKDSCFGDSGGPLTVQVNGRARLAGVVSWGGDGTGGGMCAVANKYGVYGRIIAVRQWVRDTIAMLR
ncbi:MAG: serine protease, partial [Pseudomonadota bacterium]